MFDYIISTADAWGVSCGVGVYGECLLYLCLQTEKQKLRSGSQEKGASSSRLLLFSDQIQPHTSNSGCRIWCSCPTNPLLLPYTRLLMIKESSGEMHWKARHNNCRGQCHLILLPANQNECSINQSSCPTSPEAHASKSGTSIRRLSGSDHIENQGPLNQSSLFHKSY